MKRLALLLAILLLTEAIFPSVALALTSGPTQPELTSFSQVTNTENVDLFTGDFKYNIPLFNVPGINGAFPLNLNYNSVINMEEEASMVGLGWNIGIGSIDRELRGIPDDFNGTTITKTTSLEPEVEMGFNFKISPELFTADFGKNVSFGGFLNLDLTTSYSNYSGVGFGFGAGFTGDVANSDETSNLNLSVNASSSSVNGLEYNSGISGSLNKLGNASINSAGNTIDGLSAINFSLTGKISDKKYVSGSVSLTDRPNSYPSYQREFIGTNYSFNAKGGLELWGVFVNGSTGGYFKRRALKNNNIPVKIRTYGQAYLENASDDQYALMDYNRISEKPVNFHSIHLPPPATNPDNFTVTGHGIGGIFQYQRDDFGTFRERKAKTLTAGLSQEFEVGGGTAFEVGGDVVVNYETAKSEPKSSAVDKNFKKNPKGKFVKHGMFRFIDEFSGEFNDVSNAITSTDNNTAHLFENEKYMSKDQILKYDLDRADILIAPNLKNKVQDESNLEVNDEYLKNSNTRAKRKYIKSYTTDELTHPLIPGLTLPHLDVKPYSAPLNILKINQTNHLGKTRYTQLDEDKINAFEIGNEYGTRYIYGLPVKNRVKKETVFAINQQADICKSIVDIPHSGGVIDHHNDAPFSNNLLEITETPEYASSFLLTSILGDDYIDTDPNDGVPNEKDRGSWTRVDYIRTTNEQSFYNWRIPFNGATYNPGEHALAHDDTANFIYGEREQYYPFIIETSTHIARFQYSRRKDARGAHAEIQNENDPTRLGAYSYMLDKISLYSKGNNEETLIKTAHFTYSQNSTNPTNGLCTDIPNENRDTYTGKLTLLKLAITNYKNTRGLTTPYVFEYFDTEAYDNNSFDRWGVYKDNSMTPCKRLNEPYTDQSNPNNKINAFHIKSITLPSGAKINVEIERDSYAYVQDKKATRMFKILGIGQPPNQSGFDELKHNNSDELNIYFEPVSGYNQIEDYIKGLYNDELFGHQLTFKLYNKPLGPNSASYNHLVGASYIDIDQSYIDVNNNVGVVRLKELKLLENKVSSFNNHPFLVQSWQKLKLNLRQLLSPNYNIEVNNSNDSDISKNFKKVQAAISNFKNVFNNFYQNAANDGYGSTVDLSNSFIRLVEPSGNKYGGGIRTKSIIISDVWDKEGVEIEYGKVYEYSTEIIDENGVVKTISSGVAANEPYIGKEENNLYHFSNFIQDLKYGTDLIHFNYSPVNDNSLPGPRVGYSKVKARSLPSHYMLKKHNGEIVGLPSYTNYEPSTTGEVVTEFYTYKEYPYLLSSTFLEKDVPKPRLLPVPFVGFVKNDSYAGTQGYLCQSNDMHGKLRKISYFGQSKSGSINKLPASSQEYLYHDESIIYPWGAEKLKARVLKNHDLELLVNHEGQKTYKGELGIERKAYGEVRYNAHTRRSLGVGVGVNTILPFFPVPVPGIWPVIKYNRLRSEIGVVTKEIKRKGVLKEVIAQDGQSIIKTESLAYDPYTGSPVLTTINDEFNQQIYNFDLPAYLGYKGMGPAYKHIDFEFDYGTPINSSDMYGIQIDPCTGYLAFIYNSYDKVPDIPQGSLVILTDVDDPEKKSVATYLRATTSCCPQNKFKLLFSVARYDLLAETPFTAGKVNITKAYNVKVIRSGNDNLLNAEGQSISLMNNPLPVINDVYSQVIDASACTYSDSWKYFSPTDSCGFVPTVSSFEGTTSIPGCDTTLNYASNISYNEYDTGARGIFRKEQTFRFKADRNNDNLRRKGVLNNFNILDWSQANMDIVNNNWLFTNRISKVNDNYIPLEWYNPLHIHSSVYISNGAPMPSTNDLNSPHLITAKSDNSRFYESGFTSFESYENTSVNNSESNGNNLDFESNNKLKFQKYRVTDIIGSVSTLKIDRKYIPSNKLEGLEAEVIFENVNNGTSHTSKADIIGESSSPDGFTQIDVSYFACDNVMNTLISHIIIKEEVASISNNYTVSTLHAHTGHQSLQVQSPISHEINSLDLELDKYHLSAWIYVDDNTITNLTSTDITLSIDGQQLDFIGQRIDGWQQIRGTFDYVPSALHKNITLIVDPGSMNTIYLDDLRIHPDDAMMESFVYDPDNYLLKYTHDDNNYFTKFIYNGAGEMISIQKETERGVKTINEGRTYLVTR